MIDLNSNEDDEQNALKRDEMSVCFFFGFILANWMYITNCLKFVVHCHSFF